MQTITICGSMKFADDMKSIAFELESVQGYNVLQCTYNELDLELTPDMRENLKNAHLRKIDMSEAIYVVDMNGYIGEQVRQEIEYAKKKGKKIILHSKR